VGGYFGKKKGEVRAVFTGRTTTLHPMSYKPHKQKVLLLRENNKPVQNKGVGTKKEAKGGFFWGGSPGGNGTLNAPGDRLGLLRPPR